MSTAKVIAGLGNPGDRYVGTRHNVGFELVDMLAAEDSRAGWRRQGELLCCQTKVIPDGEALWVLKPQSFMNLSGPPVAQFLRYHRLDPQELVVVHDEIDLPLGVMRIRRGGGDGGHRGVRSLCEALGTPEFLRVRLGVGRPQAQVEQGAKPEVADWVLGKFRGNEGRDCEEMLRRGIEALRVLIMQGIEKAQNKFNG